MLFRQIINDDLGCASYLVACGGEAAIIDPQYDISPYVDLARTHGLRITRVLETHDHADHISGHGRLAELFGAQVYAPAGSGATYPHHVMRGGDVIAFGNARIHVLETPGHRPEHVSFGVEDIGRGDGVVSLLTGDSLLVGDVARPDLAVDAEEGGALLHASVQRLLAHEGHVEVFPGHVGGSLCGSARLSGKTSSTIEGERRFDPLLSIVDPADFTSALLDGLKPRPPHVEHIVACNRGGFITASSNPDELSAGRVAELLDDGAVLIDVRDESDYHAGHIDGSWSVPDTEAGVGTRAAWLADPGRHVVLVADNADQAASVAMKLRAVGQTAVVGYLRGVVSWQAAGYALRGMQSISVHEFAERWRDEALRATMTVIDVRDPDEWRGGVIPGSVLISLPALASGAFDPEIVRGKAAAIVCLSGSRAGQAASILERQGVGNIVHVTRGGVLHMPGLGVPLEHMSEVIA